MIRRLLLRLGLIRPSWDDLTLRERLLVASIKRFG